MEHDKSISNPVVTQQKVKGLESNFESTRMKQAQEPIELVSDIRFQVNNSQKQHMEQENNSKSTQSITDSSSKHSLIDNL